MAVLAGYSRHRMLDELNSPLYTAAGDGANVNVYSPAEQRLRIQQNISGDTALIGTPGTGVTAEERIDATGIQRTRLTLTAVSLGNGGDAAALGIGALIYTFPAGPILLTAAAMMTGAFSSTGAYTNTLDAGLGSVIASGVVSVLGGTATFEDMIGGTTTDALNAGGAVVATQSSTGSIVNRLVASSGAHTLHLNAAGTWTDIAAAAPVLFTGVVEFSWKKIV